MTRAGSLCLGLSVACIWFIHLSEIFRISSMVLLVLGLALLLIAREPWPQCCEHCPPYAACDRADRA